VSEGNRRAIQLFSETTDWPRQPVSPARRATTLVAGFPCTRQRYRTRGKTREEDRGAAPVMGAVLDLATRPGYTPSRRPRPLIRSPPSSTIPRARDRAADPVARALETRRSRAGGDAFGADSDARRRPFAASAMTHPPSASRASSMLGVLPPGVPACWRLVAACSTTSATRPARWPAHDPRVVERLHAAGSGASCARPRRSACCRTSKRGPMQIRDSCGT